MEKERINLENISGGAGREHYYCVEGYSKEYGGLVKLYVSTEKDAVNLCKKLGMETDCIKEVNAGY